MIWILIFYSHGLYGPDAFSVIGRYKTNDICQQMGKRIQRSITRQDYWCIEEIK